MKFSTLINWYDLNNNVVVRLNKDFNKHLLYLMLKNAGNKKKLAKALELNRHQITLYYSYKSNFSIASFKKIMDYLRLDLNLANIYIEQLGRKNKCIIKPKLPFNLNSIGGVALRSIVNSEGYVSPYRGTTMHIRVPEINTLESAIKFSKQIFGEFGVGIQKTKGKNTHELFLPSIIADCLKLSGIVGGKKSINNPNVPNDIISGNEDFHRVYLGWSFVCEMECSHKVIKLCRYVDVTNLLGSNEINSLRYGMNFKQATPRYIFDKVYVRKPNLLLDEMYMLKTFNINKTLCLSSLWKSKKGRVTAKWSIIISNKEDLKKLFEIDIPNKKKKEKIEKELNSYASENILMRRTYKNTFLIFKRLVKEDGIIKRSNFIDALKKNKQRKWIEEKADRHIRKMLEKNFIKRIAGGKYQLLK